MQNQKSYHYSEQSKKILYAKELQKTNLFEFNKRFYYRVFPIIKLKFDKFSAAKNVIARLKKVLRIDE